MNTIEKLEISYNELIAGLFFSLPFLFIHLFLAYRFSPSFSLMVFVGFVVVALIFLYPIIGFLLSSFVIFSGIIWGLGISQGFLPLAILSIIAWIINGVCSLNFSLVWDKQISYLLAYLAMVITSVIFALYPLYAFKFMFVYLKLFLFYIFTMNVIKTEKHIWYALYTMVVSTLLSVVYGFYKIFFTTQSPGELVVNARLRGLSDDPNAIALHIVLLVPVLLLLAFQSKRKLKALLYILSIFILTAGLVATFSRGGTVAFAVVVGVIFYLKRSRNLFLILLAIILFLIIFVIPPDFWSHLQTLFDLSKFMQDESLRERSRLLMGGIQMFLQHPIFGIGIGNFLVISRNFVLEHLAVHNTIVHVAAETGILGVLFFSLALFRTFKNFHFAKGVFEKAGKDRLAIASQGLSVGFLGVFVMCLFISNQEAFIVWLLFGFSVAVRKVAENVEPVSTT